MTATTEARQSFADDPDTLPLGLAAAARVYGGALVGVSPYGDDANYLVDATADRNLKILGCARETVPNPDESVAGNVAGRYEVQIDRRPALLVNSGDITADHIGRRCFVVDNQTVALASSGSTRPMAGKILAVTTDGVLVSFVDEPPENGELVARLDIVAANAGTDQTDLTAAATTQAFTLLASAPPGVYAVWYEVLTAFAGGAASSVALDVGITAGNLDAYVDDADVFAGTITYQPGTGDGLGVFYHTSGSIQALFTSDVNVALLTAGQAVIELRKIG